MHRALQAWVKAREASDWSVFAPYLQQWVDVTLEKCRCIDSTRPAYDVCLDDFERGMTSARMDQVGVYLVCGWVLCGSGPMCHKLLW